VDIARNDTLRLITGCLRPAPTGLLPILAGIAPPGLRREQLTYRLGCQADFNNQHPLYGSIPDLQSLQPQRLKSRRPFHRHAATRIASGFEIKRAWMNSWKDITPPSQFCLSPNIGLSPGSNLPRNLWLTLNRLRTGVGRFGSNMCQWGLGETASCACG